ncbi:MAG: hypothetical protein KC502_18105 [Myxococcales bacterium]|nr:hypothetical protein [Myxococcales bacterium]
MKKPNQTMPPMSSDGAAPDLDAAVEAELSALFGRTALEPSVEALGRLSDFAAQIQMVGQQRSAPSQGLADVPVDDAQRPVGEVISLSVERQSRKSTANTGAELGMDVWPGRSLLMLAAGLLLTVGAASWWPQAVTPPSEMHMASADQPVTSQQAQLRASSKQPLPARRVAAQLSPAQQLTVDEDAFALAFDDPLTGLSDSLIGDATTAAWEVDDEFAVPDLVNESDWLGADTEML